MAFRFSDLNPEQQEAVYHKDGPMLILAGAGTGKTRTITARIAWMVREGADPSRIIAVTFTNKAAKEMKERIGGMVAKDKAKLITATTFHALCMRILRGDAHRLGYKGNFTIFDESDQVGLIKKLINRVTSRDEKYDPGIAKNLISKAKNNGWAPPKDDDSVIASVYRLYLQEVHALNAMDFDDLLVNGVKLLDEHEEVRAKWQSRARHIVVDEFQDTNNLQLRLVSLLAAGKRPDVCVVGDDDQSIYGWRGAEISNILEFEHHFPNPKIIRLERNYRSAQPILDAANRLIKNNSKRREKRLRSTRGGGEPVRFLSVPDDRKEAEFLVSEIRDLQRNTPQTKWDDIAVLYRMNAQSRVLEEEFRSAGIPYRLIGGQSFYERREIRDLIAYIALFVNPDNDAALLRVINTPPRGIGATTTELALAFSSEHRLSLFEALGHPQFLEGCARKTVQAITNFRMLIQAVKAEASVSSPGRVLSRVLADCGYREDLARSCKTPEEKASRNENVDEFLRALDEYVQRNEGGLVAFLDSVTLDREREEEKNEEAPGVTLITLHAAKGLEFSHVFLVGAEDGVLPHERSKEEGTVEEERRIFYVGITRAMKTLVITWCRERTRYGKPFAGRPSPFLREILGDGVVEENFDAVFNAPVSEDELSDGFAALRRKLAQ